MYFPIIKLFKTGQQNKLTIKMYSSVTEQKITQSTTEKQIQQEENSLLLNRTFTRLKHNNNDTKAQTERLSLNSNLNTFKQVEQYRKISQNLNLMQQLKKANSQKLKKLQKNVSNLDFLRRLSFKQTLKLQNKKAKLQQTQTMVQFLHNLKEKKQQVEQQKYYERKKLCFSLRESSIHNRSLSQSVYNIVKQERVKQFKEENSRLMESYEKNIEDLLQSNRRKAHQTRMSQLRLKEKLKKYEEYKIYIGRLNYEKKLQTEYKNHLQNKRYLKDVESKLKQEDKLFRKTQKLKKQTKKIEEFYLTGTGTE